MLIIHYSNRLEILAEQLATVTGESPSPPFIPETIIVQSNGMARWLSLQLARHLGICAHVRFPFPAAFIWETMALILPEVPGTSPFETPVLTWRIMELLRDLEETPRFQPLHAYLEDGDDFRSYELAHRIADHFDQYLVYRPDWISDWEAGQEEHWQAELWRRLATHDGTHRVRLQQRFFQALTLGGAAGAELPNRISLFGISALPPVYLEIFHRLSEFMDVHLFLLNPCQEYWGDILAERDIARRDSEAEAEEAYLTVGNPLLASLGKQGRDFIDLLQTYPAAVEEPFVTPEETSLLCHLQQDILTLQDRGSEDSPPLLLDPEDRSVQIHACHSPMREVEVLYDQLLALFQENPDLKPSDVIVMTPDIEAYGATIEAVFATADSERYIPFSIADRGVRYAHPLVDTFFALLDMPGSRYDVNRLLALLEIPALQRRFGFSPEDLPLVYRWMRETGIRWGIDADNRANLGLPATREHTWQAGLDRLLLGYALPGDNRRLWQDILPYDEVEGGEAQIMGRLQHFAEALFALETELAGRQPLVGWAGTLSELLARFLAPNLADEPELQLLRTALERMAQSAELAIFHDPVSLDVVKSTLRRQLEIPEANVGQFLTGGVTFCALVPMRSIPFRVVCLIGMNDGSYPRTHHPLGFDLMAQRFRKGDRSRRNDDRYLFLESLLSARQCLYISFIGNDIRDNTPIPPSVLVSELVDVIERGFRFPDGNLRDHLLTRHPLQPFSHRYFTGEAKLFSYSEELARASRLAGRGEQDSKSLLASDLPDPDPSFRTVELSQLSRFFANPARYLLRQRLGIHLEEGEGILETREPFTLDALSQQRLREHLLSLHQEGLTPLESLTVLQGKGSLPHGGVGERWFDQERIQVERFATRLQTVSGDRLEPLEVNLTLDDFHITGWLNGLMPQGLLGYRLAKVRPQDRLILWLRHLVLNCLAPEGIGLISHWIGEDKEIILNPVLDPESQLRTLLQYYWQGLRRPLPFFPKSSYDYAEAVRQKKNNPEAMARKTWESSDYHRGESEDLYYRLAFRGTDPLDDTFETLAIAIFEPIFQHLFSDL